MKSFLETSMCKAMLCSLQKREMDLFFFDFVPRDQSRDAWCPHVLETVDTPILNSYFLQDLCGTGPELRGGQSETHKIKAPFDACSIYEAKSSLLDFSFLGMSFFPGGFV